MPFFVVDDQAHAHPKFDEAGNAAIGAWVRMGSWSRAYETDGFVPASTAKRYSKPRELKQLVKAGLLEATKGGYRFHDWADLYARFDEERRANAEPKRGRKRAKSPARSKAAKKAAQARWDAQRDAENAEPDAQNDAQKHAERCGADAQPMRSASPPPRTPPPTSSSSKSSKTVSENPRSEAADQSRARETTLKTATTPLTFPSDSGAQTATGTEPKTVLKPDKAMALLGALQQHPALAKLATRAYADHLAGSIGPMGLPLADAIDAVHQAGRKAGGSAAVGKPWAEPQERVVAYLTSASTKRKERAEDTGTQRPERELVDLKTRKAQRAAEIEAAQRDRARAGGKS
jgi:hypothetical protein